MLRSVMAYARINKLSAVHPVEKLTLVIIPIILSGFSQRFLISIINIVLFTVLHRISGTPIKILAKFIFGVTGFTVLSSIPLIIDYGAEYCVVLMLKSISGSIAVAFLALTTPLDDLLYMLSKIKPLRDICDIAKGMERFLVIIEDEFLMLLIAVKSRGGFDTFSLKFKSASKVAALLFVNTMRRWKEIRESVNSRCYRGYMPYLKKEFSFSVYRFLLISLYNIAIGLILWL